MEMQNAKPPQCLNITEKVSFNIASEASYVYIYVYYLYNPESGILSSYSTVKSTLKKRNLLLFTLSKIPKLQQKCSFIYFKCSVQVDDQSFYVFFQISSYFCDIFVLPFANEADNKTNDLLNNSNYENYLLSKLYQNQCPKAS